MPFLTDISKPAIMQVTHLGKEVTIWVFNVGDGAVVAIDGHAAFKVTGETTGLALVEGGCDLFLAQQVLPLLQALFHSPTEIDYYKLTSPIEDIKHKTNKVKI